MSFNTFGKIFRFTTWGESHGPAIGCVVDGCPPNVGTENARASRDDRSRRTLVLRPCALVDNCNEPGEAGEQREQEE